MTSKGHVFVWGWGCLSQAPVPYTQVSPQLVEALDCSSLRCISSGNRHTVASTHTGDLFLWGPSIAPSASCDEVDGGDGTAEHSRSNSKSKSRSASLSAAAQMLKHDEPSPHSQRSRKKLHQHSRSLSVSSTGSSSSAPASASNCFVRVDASPGGVAVTSCSRQHLFAVGTNGAVYKWNLEPTVEGPLNSVGDGDREDGESRSVSGRPENARTQVQEEQVQVRKEAPLGAVLVSISQRISRLSCGGNFVVAVTTSGRAFSWGSGRHGRLGLGDAQDRVQPTVMHTLRDRIVSHVACGWNHAAVIADSGDVYAWGCGKSGRLGIGDDLGRDVSVPTHVSALIEPVVDLDVGYHHTAVIDVNGAVFTWGADDKGQLGHSSYAGSCLPVRVLGLGEEHIVQVACGAFHTAVVSAVGEVYSWGWNFHGQLGHGDLLDRCTPQLVAALVGMDVLQISCGGEFTIAVTDQFIQVQHDYFDQEREPFHAVEPAPADDYMIVDETGAFDLEGDVNRDSLYNTADTDRYSNASDPGQRGRRWRRRRGSGKKTGSPSSSPPQLLPSPFHDDGVVGVSSDTRRKRRESASPLPPLPPAVTFTPDGAGSRGRSHSPFTTPSSDVSTSPGPSTPIQYTRGVPQAIGSGSSSVSIGSSAGGYSGSGGRRVSVSPPLVSVAEDRRSNASSTSGASSSADTPKKNSILHFMYKVFNRGGSAGGNDACASGTDPSSGSGKDSDGDGYRGGASSQAYGMGGAGGAGGGDSVNNSNPYLIGGGAPHEGENVISAGAPDFRPHNLPPKSAEEAARHHAEVNRMNQLYRAKLIKEAKVKAERRKKDQQRVERELKEKEKQRKRNLERENKLKTAAKEWLEKIIPMWDTKKSLAKAKELVWKVGIPPQIRGKIWPLAIGNALMITPDLFEIFGMHARTARHEREAQMKLDHCRQQAAVAAAAAAAAEAAARDGDDDDDDDDDDGADVNRNIDSAPLPRPAVAAVAATGAADVSSQSSRHDKPAGWNLSKENTFSYIDADLTRTFPQLAFFQHGCSMNEQLRSILETFCFYRPDIGYVQGMSYLAGNLLLYMDPYPAFVCFANLLNAPFFHVFLKLDTSRMDSRYQIFNELFQEHLPRLYNHFVAEDVRPDLYFMEWCMTLFGKRLALEVVGRVWDCFLIFGEAFVYRTAVAVLKCLEKELIDEPFESCMKKLTSLPKTITEKQLFHALAPIKLTQSIMERLLSLQQSS